MDQSVDPTSHQRGRPTETIQQISENNLQTESNIWSQVAEWARYLDILTVSCNVTSTSSGNTVYGRCSAQISMVVAKGESKTTNNMQLLLNVFFM
jgi:hypothetical protein